MPENTSRQRLDGQALGGCRLIRRLGAGGMAEVYLAEQEHLGNRTVAVKIVRLDEMTTQHGRAESDDIAERFLREGKLLASFFHPNILPVHDSGAEHGLLYLIMHYAQDGSLAAALHGRGARPLHLPLELPLALDIVSQVAAALQYTHDHGVVHRDVKPANILMQVEPDGSLRMLLADFGIATGVDATAHLNELTGTVAYMAPEQFRGYFSPASDQYSLAVMAYLLLAGRTPFEGGIAEQMYAHVHTAPPPLRAFNPDVPLAVSGAIVRGLAKTPEHRYPSVAAFAEALRSGTEPYADTTIVGAPLLEAEQLDPVGAIRHDGLLIFPNGAQRRLADAAQTNALAPEDGGEEDDQAERSQMPTRRKLGLLAACLCLLLLALLVDIGYKQYGEVANGSPGRDAVTQHQIGTQTPMHTARPTQQAPTATVAVAPTGTATQPPASPPTVAATASEDAASIISSPPTQGVQPGQHLTVNLALRNTGTTTWSSADGYVLTCDTIRHPEASCSSALVAGIGGSPIVPGGQVSFTLQLTAPSAPGTYSLWLDMAHNNVLFSTQDAQVVLDVEPAQSAPPPAVSPTPQSSATPTATDTPQPTATATPQPTESPAPQPTDTPAPTDSAAPGETPMPASTLPATERGR